MNKSYCRILCKTICVYNVIPNNFLWALQNKLIIWYELHVSSEASSVVPTASPKIPHLIRSVFDMTLNCMLCNGPRVTKTQKNIAELLSTRRWSRFNTDRSYQSNNIGALVHWLEVVTWYFEIFSLIQKTRIVEFKTQRESELIWSLNPPPPANVSHINDTIIWWDSWILFLIYDTFSQEPNIKRWNINFF